MKYFVFTLLLLVVSAVQAAEVKTLNVRSASMNKDVQVVVVVPDQAKGATARNCPVVYLLHGYSGNASTWISIKPDLPRIADEKGIIFVCPDGKNSWYWDSPKNPEYRYETFVSSELVNFIDNNYNTIKDRKARAITGLSMGGHGALWISFRHKDLFGAAGSTSGGADIRLFPKNWEMSKQLGEYETNKDIWDNHTVINQVHLISNKDLALIIDCGVSDFFYEVNKELHQCLLHYGIEHDFISRPGGHTSPYWNNSIDYQILFFSKYFSGK